MSLMSNVQRRRSGVYECRVQLPKKIAGKLAPEPMRRQFPDLINPKTGCFKHEIARSLSTSDPDVAKKLGRKESPRLHDMIERAVSALTQRRSPDTPVEADEIAADLVAELLAVDEEEREGDDRRNLPGVRDGLPDVSHLAFGLGELGMEQDHFIAYGELIEEDAATYRQALARRDTSVIEPEVQRILKRKAMEMPAEPLARRRLHLAALQAVVKAYDLMAQRQRGDLVENSMPSGDQLGPRLSEAFDRWKSGVTAKGGKKPARNTILEAENIVLRFKEWHGDWRLGVITKAHVREFRDALAKMPSRLSAKLRKLQLKELLKRDLSKFQPRSATTVNKQLTILSAIFANAQRDGLMDGMPGFLSPFDKDVKLGIDEREIEEREPFDLADLRAIFGTPVYCDGKRPKGGAGEAAFWFPLIGLMSGMRLSEMAGLLIRDLRQDEETGRWLFDVNHEVGNSVKNASSIRHVPVHRELERIGLLRYRDGLLATGHGLDDPLWPDIGAVEKSEERSSTSWSKWFGRCLRTKAGITSSRKVFHSFRHTFKRMARSAELPEELHDALTGHSAMGRTGRKYGKGYDFETFVSAIDRIQIPDNSGLSGLNWYP